MPTIGTGLRGGWGQSNARGRVLRAVRPAALATDRQRLAPWGQGTPSASAGRLAWRVSDRADRLRRALWVPYPRRAAAGIAAPWVRSARADQLVRVPWGVYPVWLDSTARAPWVKRRILDDQRRAPWGLFAPLGHGLALRVPRARPLDDTWRIVFGRYTKRYYVALFSPEFPPVVFGAVPTLRSYVVLNNVTLVRASDLALIETQGLSIEFDADSWTLGWSASVHGSALALVQPPGVGQPVELEASINGDVFRLLVEQIERDRRFPAARLSISGRGISAALADPYVPAVDRDNASGAMTAAQIANDALTINATSIGWSVDFGLTDWLVPAGAWSHRGTHMQAVQAVAKAAGGYVRSDRVGKVLYVRPRWPVLPWQLDLATPEVTIPDAAVARESLQLVERAEFDGVYVSGTDQGVLALVKRTGFAGTTLADMAIDPLVTHADAARQRGISEIGIPGRSALLRLELQVLPETGVIELGTVLGFNDGGSVRVGVVRAVSVQYRHPKLRQTIEVECHA